MRLIWLLAALLLLIGVDDAIGARGLRKRRQTGCSTTFTSGSRSPLYLLTAGTLNQATYRHVLATVNAASGWTYDSTLSATALTAVPSDCPSNCLQLLTLYSKTAQQLFIGTSIDYVDAYSAGDENFLLFQSYVKTTRPAGSNTIYCALQQGTCGATVPIYRYFDMAVRFDHITSTSSVAPTGYLADNFGLPICYGWSTVITTTAAATTTTGGATTTTGGATTTTGGTTTTTGGATTTTGGVTTTAGGTTTAVTGASATATATVTTTNSCTSNLSPFYRYDLPTTGARGLHDKYDTALSSSAVPSGYTYDTVHGCVLTNNVGCSCTLTQLHVFYKYDTFWNVKNYITTIGTDPLTWGYTEDTAQSLWCVPATSTSGTCGATVLIQRYYNGIDIDHALGVQLDSTLTLNGYGLDLPFMGGSQCYVWDTSMCSVTSSTSTTSDCTTYLSAFYRYDLPTTDASAPGLHDKYDTAKISSAVPSGYTYDTVHGCVLTNNIGCSCTLVQLHVFYKYDTFWKVKNYITTIGTDPLTWGYTEDTTQTLWCVPATSTSGTCGATVLIQRYYNLLDLDHALGVQSDATLTSNGYGLDLPFMGGSQCYVWDTSMCTVTSQSPSPSPVATVTVTSSNSDCTTYLSAFYRYDLPTTDASAPGLHDKYDTAKISSAVPSGYIYDTVHGCVLTNNVGCSCNLVQLHVFYKYDTFWKVKNYITTIGTDPLTWGYTEDTTQTLWCVPATSTSGTCGATVLIQRYYNLLDLDHALGVQSDATLTSNGYGLDLPFMGGSQCYVWDTSMCTVSVPSPSPSPVATVTVTVTSATSDCTTYLSAFYRYDLPTTGARGLHDKYDTAKISSAVPSGYTYDTVHGCVLTNNVGCSCTLIQLHVFYKYDTFWNVKNYITTIGTDPLTWGYTEDTTQTLWCVPATSTSGTCGATVLIQRYYNMLDIDHALGVQSDTTLTSNGYGLDLPFMGGSQCYVWDTSMCTVSVPSPSPSPVATVTVAVTSATSDCTTYLSAFYRYDLPTTDALAPGLHDKYDTAKISSAVPSGYTYDTVHGCVLTNNVGCSCTLVQLHVFYKYDTFWKVKNYITTIGTDPLTWGYTEDTTQTLWCVPATSTSGTCGATVLIQRYYNLLDLDHALGVQSDTTLTSNGYGLDLPFMGGSQCYVWATSMCTVSVPSPSPSPVATVAVTVTSATSDCT
uniref:Membrane-associated protein n=1 Tax=Plectus sambesii TaxID=2011161 RepID=A0A914WB48_9BILA